MYFLPILTLSGITNSAQLEQSISTQISAWLSAIREAQYSAVVSNLLLVALAVAIIALAMFAGWIAMYPDKPRSFFKKWRGYSWVSRLEKRYRSWIAFLVRRLSPHGAYGLSFTFGLLILGLGTWAFSNLLEEIVTQGNILSIDTQIITYIAAHRLDWVTSIMKNVTALGQGWVVIALALVAGIALRFKTKSWRPLILLGITVAGAGVLDFIFKVAVARPRPPEMLMATSATGYAFPSGHTVLTALYGALAYLLAKTRRSWEGKTIIWATAMAIAFLIGISRIYLGVHWPTDVLGGWTLAAVWLSVLLISAAIIEKIPGGGYTITGFKRPLHAPAAQPEPAELSLQPMTLKFVTGPDGLTEAQVREGVARGRANITSQRTSRSYRHIFVSNIFTRFNALLGGLFITILIVGSPQDSLFGIIIILNTVIGIIQEVRAKWALDHLALMAAAKSRVIRAGKNNDVPPSQIVADDLIELSAGSQVPVDGIITRSNSPEVDESLITGESEPVAKKDGDEVYSGSFVVAGSCRIQAVRIGEQAYARRLASAARQFALSQSELRRGINRILKYIIWFLVPTALLLITTQLLFMQNGWRDAISGSVAGIVEMVPDGLVLLTSVVMAAAVVRLARRKALIQELSAVEILARVDILCLDKTGTLTEGTMAVEQVIPIPNTDPKYITALNNPEEILGIFAAVQEHSATLNAIAAAYPPSANHKLNIEKNIPFSSDRKWSALTFDTNDSWILGSPEIILAKQKNIPPSLWSDIGAFTAAGRRVLLLAHSGDPTGFSADKPVTLPSVMPIAVIVLKEQLRKDVAQTLRYFKEQGVTVKVISGDNPQTVAAVASAAGIPDAHPQNGRELPDDEDALAALVEQHSVFGRTTPDQKKRMVEALQKRRHVVAMIGDGVNDILAIKEADFGIAMGSGTDSSRAIAQLILVNNNFSILPGVIAEGRRIIANIERTANLFITKASYVLAMALAVGVAQVPFPFLPRQLTLIGFFTIGLPALLLSLAQNTTRARSGFVPRVLRFSLPAGGIVAAIILIVYALTRQIEPRNIELARSAATLTLLGCGLSVLWLLARPVTAWQKLFTGTLASVLAAVIIVPAFRHFFALVIPPIEIWAIILFFAAICFIGIRQIKTKMLKFI